MLPQRLTGFPELLLNVGVNLSSGNAGCQKTSFSSASQLQNFAQLSPAPIEPRLNEGLRIDEDVARQKVVHRTAKPLAMTSLTVKMVMLACIMRPLPRMRPKPS